MSESSGQPAIPSKTKTSSRAKGRLAMGHARKLAAKGWPNAPQTEAHAKVVWVPDGKGGRRPIAGASEDLFGIFDLIVLAADRLKLIQVTTYGTATAASTRRAKVLDWALEHARHADYTELYVWAWRPRKGWLIWRFFQGEWVRISLDLFLVQEGYSPPLCAPGWHPIAATALPIEESALPTS